MKWLLSAISAVFLLGGVGYAQAAEPLADSDLDQVSAGAVVVAASGGSLWSAGDDGAGGTSTSFALNGLTFSLAQSTAGGQFGAGGGVIIVTE